jgi:hypothetical protein
MKIWKFLFVIGLLGASACSNSSTVTGSPTVGASPTPTVSASPSPTPSVSALNNAIVGVWVSGCLNGGNVNQPTVKSLTVPDNTLANSYITYEIFADSQCTQSLVNVQYFGAAAVSTDPNTTAYNNVNITYSDVQLTPLSQAVADSYNSSSECGFTNWQLNTAQSVFGQSCAGYTLPGAGSALFDIYSISGSNLYVGDQSTGAGDSTNDRPTALDTADAWVSQ